MWDMSGQIGQCQTAERCVRKPSQTPDRLLFTRRQVAELFGGVSIATVKRLEASGALKPLRLSRSPSAEVFYRAEDVISFVEERAKDVA
jgi:phage terminase Nu1 subunit (DNA packaging protein)